VQSLYYRRREWGELRRVENRRAVARWIVEDKKTQFKGLGLSGAETIAEIVDGPPTVGSVVGIVLRAYARRFGKPRWGDKRPAYHQDVGALLRMFPDAQFIHVVRDGRDCVASLKRMPWFRGDTTTATHVWGYAVDAGRHWSCRLPGDSWHEVGYERLVSDARSELGALCEYLGEQFHGEMLVPHLTAPTAVHARTAYHEGLFREVDATRIGAFLNGLDRRELGLMETVNRRRLRWHGYPLSDSGRRPTPALLARYAAAAARQRASIRRRHFVDALERRRQPVPLAAQLTSRQPGE